jgi:predicted transcriptional regulator
MTGMPRKRLPTPTQGELEILQVLWDRGPSTVREVLDVLSAKRPRAYTSVMSLLNIMVDKGLVAREPQGRAFVYHARKPRERTLGTIVGDVLGKAFEGAAHELVAHVLEQSKPSPRELEQIRRVIEAYQKQEQS